MGAFGADCHCARMGFAHLEGTMTPVGCSGIGGIRRSTGGSDLMEPDLRENEGDSLPRRFAVRMINGIDST